MHRAEVAIHPLPMNTTQTGVWNTLNNKGSRRLLLDTVRICMRMSVKMRKSTLPILFLLQWHGSHSFPAPTEADPQL